MKIQLLSDLHLEFGYPDSKGFINSLDPDGVDVLVLAGDICLQKHIVDVMTAMCQRYENADVIYVHGNHEFYGSDRETVVAQTQEAIRQNANLHWLDCQAKEIRGRRFAGAPLWFSWQDGNKELERFMNDFYVIKDLDKWVYAENLRAQNFIEGSIDENDIVITHHLPTFKSVAERYMGSDLNRFFVHDMHDFIKRRGPSLWLHGHTHDSFDYNVEHDLKRESTRIVCNPRGYWPHDLNPDFNKDLVIEV